MSISEPSNRNHHLYPAKPSSFQCVGYVNSLSRREMKVVGEDHENIVIIALLKRLDSGTVNGEPE